MKRKLSRKIKAAKYYGAITGCSWGLFTIISLICVCGLLAGRFDVPEYALYAAVCFSLAMGGYISGHVYGKIRRHGGMASGAACGAVLFVIVTAFGCLYIRDFFLMPVIRNFIFLVIPAVIGGITGVNSKIYKAPYS